MPIKRYGDGKYGFSPENAVPADLDIENIARIMYDTFYADRMPEHEPIPVYESISERSKQTWRIVAEAVCSQIYGELQELLDHKPEEPEDTTRQPKAWWYLLGIGPHAATVCNRADLKQKIKDAVSLGEVKPEY